MHAGSYRGSYSPVRGQGRIAAITSDLFGVSTLTLPPSHPPSQDDGRVPLLGGTVHRLPTCTFSKRS